MAKVSLRAYNREIEAMTDRGQLDEAIAHCRHILKTFPKHLETYRLLGKAYLEYKRYKDAVDIFSRVLVVEPNDFVSNVGMSIIRDEENSLDDAIWHMERAFEIQPSNAAIQGELQRLYGRREGVQPPRIRMTRGALAHMYVQGELYPQAISEIKSVLKDDQGRSDMQVLLARAYFRSGQKTLAADEASSVLRRYPYCLDANRVLVEILGVDRPENAQVYRQRVIELDPYAAQVSGTVFQTSEVGDAAVTLERLDWNGQQVGGQADWESKAIRLESENRSGPQAQPDWLKNGGFADATPAPSASTATPNVVPPLPASTPSFDFSAPTPTASAPVPAQPTPADAIPDFLRDAGWGQSTGTFDESKSSFVDEPVASTATSDALPIAQGDMPDWVKAMAPPQATQSAIGAQSEPAQEEELPDWINNIGKGALSASALASPNAELDWLNDVSQPAASESTSDQPDWMKSLGQPASTQNTSSDQPDWMKGFGDEALSTPTSSIEQPDWLTQFGSQSEEPVASTPAGNEFDFLNELTESSSQPAPAANTADLGKSQSEIDDSLAWLENLAAKQGATEGLLIKPEDRSAKEPDWVSQVKSAPQPVASEPVVSQPPASQPPAVNTADLGKSQSEIDDSLAWLENLAAKQGATEGLLIKPEDRTAKEPDWVSQVKSAPQTPATQQPELQPVVPDIPVSQPPVTAQPTATNLADLGKSQSEVDDALAWFESLAAKQGATEGLLIKPEDRTAKEPDWVSQVKSAPQTPATPEPQPVVPDMPVSQPPMTAQPTATNVADLGKSQSEVDDALAWFESLAAKQGATEGLLIKPEDRTAKEPDWVSQAKSAPQTPVTKPSEPQPVISQPAVSAEQPSISTNDTAAWLRSLDQEESTPEPVSSNDQTAMWLKTLDEPEPASALPTIPSDDMPSWLQSIGEEKAPVTDVTIPAKEPEPESDRMKQIEQPVASAVSAPEEDVPSWLKGMDEESKISAPQDDLPAWMRDATGEVVAEPTKIEPTRPTDWHPVTEQPVETPAPAPVVQEQPKPEPVAPVQEKPKPAPVKKPAPKPAEAKPATPPAPYREPLTQRGTGMLVMPIDPVLGSARSELSRSNIPGALETYAKLIKKGRLLDEVIFDLREALNRFPVEVSILQSLGDAYMRANRLQDALDAYTKAEELLR